MSFDLKIQNGDIAISRDGSLSLVADNDKIRQDIVKILLTSTKENKFHSEYGSEVGALKVGQIIDKELLEIDLKSSAESAVRKLISLQKEQQKRQYLSPAEIIVDIIDVSVSREESDPRYYNIFVSVLTQKLTSITESITVKII